MFQSPQYPIHPPSYMPFDYRTPPMSPSPAAGMHGYYSPRYSVHTATPSPRSSPKSHGRHSSQDQGHGYGFQSPRVPPFGTYSSPRYQTPQPQQHSTHQRNTDYVSYSDRYWSSGRRSRVPAEGMREKKQRYWEDTKYRFSGDTKHRPSRSQKYYNVVFDDEDYLYYDAPPPYQHHKEDREADYCYYCDQVPIYTEAESTPHRSRARRASHSSRPTPPPQKPRPSTAKSTPKATDEDARRAGIPAGYSIKNWDPNEEPICLLGSVFDANSLGKWIYDWTVYHYGAGTPMAEMSGELWLLLIQLAGKIKRAEEIMPKIRQQENKEMVEEFLDSGDRLWGRFSKLLQSCEEYMLRAAKKENGGKKVTTMGKNSGGEFVDSIFGRDRELEKTERMMTGMRLWSMRFDANCEEILRHPSA
ncbi:hypothetical protein M501DRAFT_927134 [Patellaria atrata CBS 101060]|uniref:Vegetative cell wall protein gp1 n=1 Tax=Patellaria atrata CBS 101060 TaxID=1346257 RepID=A0A9P4SFX1_9PEZI|nr:hypothetical protein M501DRAFT_927134 [Patellaria atrata CBS 101060]